MVLTGPGSSKGSYLAWEPHRAAECELGLRFRAQGFCGCSFGLRTKRVSCSGFHYITTQTLDKDLVPVFGFTSARVDPEDQLTVLF